MRTSVNVPEDILAEFDDTWQDEGIESRSRAIREAISEYVETHHELESASGQVAAIVAFDYQHHLVITELHTVQHEFQDVLGRPAGFPGGGEPGNTGYTGKLIKQNLRGTPWV
jgi:CopG family nickel-responsive transcriptional regulator